MQILVSDWMDSGLETALVSAFIAAAVSFSVAVFGPLFTYCLWKRQKRKEQQLTVSQRFAALSASLFAFTGIDAMVGSETQTVATALEMHALLRLIPVLFNT